MNSKLCDELCPICYEILSGENFIELISCKHQFCRYCLTAILSQNNISCPLDRNPIDKIIDSKFSQNPILMSEYRIFLLFPDKDIYLMEIESYLSAILLKFNSSINEIIRKVENLLEIEQDFLIQNSEKRIIENIVNEINKIVNKTNYHFEEDSVVFSEKCVQFLNYLSDIQFSRRSLIYTKLFELRSILDKSPFRNQFFNRIILKEILDASSEEKIKIINEELLDLTDLSLYYKSLVITHFQNNNELYKSVQSNINETDIDLCLICTGEINQNHCCKLSNCNHKVCFDCANTFLITHARCPFDNCETFAYLEITTDCNNRIVKINSLKYFTDNYKTIFQRFYENISNFNYKRIKVIVDLSRDFVVLMELVNDLKKSRENQKPDIKKCNLLFNEIKKEFEKLSKNTYIRSYITKISLFYHKLGCFEIFKKHTVYYETVGVIHNELVSVNKLLRIIDDYDDFVMSLFGLEDEINGDYSYENMKKIYDLIKEYESIYSSRSMSSKFYMALYLRQSNKAKLYNK